mgnify:CR=1 FL=1
MSDSSLVSMKKVEIIIGGEDLHLVEELLTKARVSGFTIVPNVSGKGHHGIHEGHLLFNDMHTLDMLFTIVPESLVEPILAGIGTLFDGFRRFGSALWMYVLIAVFTLLWCLLAVVPGAIVAECRIW